MESADEGGVEAERGGNCMDKLKFGLMALPLAGAPMGLEGPDKSSMREVIEREMSTEPTLFCSKLHELSTKALVDLSGN